MNREKIIEKLQKIERLMNGAKTEGEVQAATLAMQKLLAKYNLSKADIQIKLTEQEICKPKLNVTEHWQVSLASAIADNFRCMIYHTVCGRKIVYLTLLGLKEDVKIATKTYEMAEKAARKLYRVWAKEQRNLNVLFNEQMENSNISRSRLSSMTRSVAPTSKERTSWYEGFAYGVRESLNNQRLEDEELAIVLQVPAIVEDEYNKIKFAPSRVKCRSFASDAFNSGQKSGTSYGNGNRLIA